MVDTGAAGKSTAGYGQYQAYQKLFSDTQINSSKEGAVNATFSIRSTKSIGLITIDTPIRQCEFYIVQANTPFLLGITDMDTKGIMLDNLQNKLISSKSNILVLVVQRFGHPFLMWGPMITTYCHLTETELRTLHRQFGHLLVLRLVRLLERASHNDDSRNHRQLLERITKYCSKCQKHAGALLRFKFTLRDDNLDFNHSVYIDIMYINGLPLLHVVDEATRFQAAR
jgi:hypothetical protein